MQIKVNSANFEFLECFSSETRVKIIQLLDDKPMSIKELAESLGLSSAIITKHIQKMEKWHIVGTESVAGTRGRRKVCHLLPDSITLQLKSRKTDTNRYTHSIPIGQYSDYDVMPTCGLASETSIIGMIDDPRYFSDPDHIHAKHLWFASGYVEYRIPNYTVTTQTITGVTISLEICSEAPGFNENWPSDITFSLNDVALGTWTCPGDFGKKRGAYTPDWWVNMTQYGLLKTITINADGCFLDGIQLSNMTIDDLRPAFGEELRFRISCEDQAEHGGGVSLFGKHFGNYNQDIEVVIYYDQTSNEGIRG